MLLAGWMVNQTELECWEGSPSLQALAGSSNAVVAPKVLSMFANGTAPIDKAESKSSLGGACAGSVRSRRNASENPLGSPGTRLPAAERKAIREPLLDTPAALGAASP